MTRVGAIRAAVRDRPQAGEEMLELARLLFPLNRSLTGDGVRETLRVLGERLPLELVEVASGTTVYDWTVPPEWNVREAWIADASGRRIVDFAESNLHLVGYSEPVEVRVSGSELVERLHWLPDHPDWIPARTSYYDRSWGFCVTASQRQSILPEAEYDVCIDSTLDESGSLVYGEVVLVGSTPDEVLLSTYVCHPSLANDNLSGIVVLAELAAALAEAERRRTYRLVFAPSTIGALVWLARNEERLDRIRHGLVVSCVGDSGPLTYKRTRRGDTPIDRAAGHVVRSRPGGSTREFVPWGGDERQFSSPGFDLPVGSLTRTPHGAYPEYHTSADDLSFISAASLADSLDAVAEILDVLEDDLEVEGDLILERVEPRGEPQLGRRGLYEAIGAGHPVDPELARKALLWVLNAADGETSLVEAAERAELPFSAVVEAAAVLRDAGLVRERRP